jgi:hypothetical protein
MAQQGYSIGRDITLVAILANGTSLRFGKVTAFDAKPETTKQKVKGLDGTVSNLRYHEGWSGTFRCERRDPSLDGYFAQIEANYYAGTEEPPCTIQQTILEPNGAISQFRFEQVVFNLDDPGSWGSDKTVAQVVSFEAARRIQQA